MNDKKPWGWKQFTLATLGVIALGMGALYSEALFRQDMDRR